MDNWIQSIPPKSWSIRTQIASRQSSFHQFSDIEFRQRSSDVVVDVDDIDDAVAADDVVVDDDDDDDDDVVVVVNRISVSFVRRFGSM